MMDRTIYIDIKANTVRPLQGFWGGWGIVERLVSARATRPRHVFLCFDLEHAHASVGMAPGLRGELVWCVDVGGWFIVAPLGLNRKRFACWFK